MKKIMLIMMCLLLCACSNTNDIKNRLDSIFTDESVQKNRVNNYTDYIEYYLPSDVCEENSEPLSFSFSVDDCKFIMNINVSNIINNEYYSNAKVENEGFFDEKKLFYSHKGEFVDLNNETNTYVFNAYDYGKNYLLYFVCDKVNFYGYCPSDKIDVLASKMLQMVRAINVMNDKIVSDFSSIDVVDYQKSTVNLFKNIMPKEGRIEDMMVDTDNKVSEQ